MTGATPVWIGRDLRLDPSVLPQRWSVPTGRGADRGEDAAVYLDEAGIVLKRRLAGLPLTIALPLSAYRGVAVRVTEDEGGRMVASVELWHDDPALGLPLTVTRDMEQAAIDWDRWSATLHLPLLMIEPDGRVTHVPRPPAIAMDRALPRRRRAALARRPRFLVRRKVGRGGPMPVLTGWREIAGYE